MMREIKFRGKSRRSGRWVYGLPAFDSGGIMGGINGWMGEDGGEVYQEVEVDFNTIGQYTGLKDKNGKEIYEGDILRTETDKPMVVSWNEKFASFCLWREGWAFNHFFGEACDPERCAVIGNIHENPELLTQN